MNIVRQDGGSAQGRSYKTSCGGQIEIVGPVRNQFGAKTLENVIAANQKCARHLLYIASGQSNEVAVEPGKQHAIDAFAIEVLAQLRLSQAEGLIQLAGGIGETRQIVQLVRSEKFGGALFGSQMHEGQTGSFGFQFAAEVGELGDRLATKSSAKVAEEHQEQGAVGRNGGNRFAGLRLVRLQ